MLTAYDGQAITYDDSGNPLSYYNGTRYTTFTWEEGRRLTSAVKNSATSTYSYDHNGIRTSKTVDGVTHNYLYASGKLLRESYGDTVLDFFYDATGTPYALNYTAGGTTTTYYYITNLQGDVMYLVTADGHYAAIYEYDPYGKVLGAGGTIAQINPLRYRGYYYDSETALYYVASRYYDPAICRFINADDASLLGANGDFASYNLFAYCGNNPVNRKDEGGNLWNIAFGAVLGGVLAGVSKAVECIKRGDSIKQAVGQVLVSTACGAVGGALAATGIGIGGQVVIGASLGAVESAANQKISTGSIDLGTLAVDTLCGAVGGFSGGPGASSGSKFMSYHSKEFVKNIGLYGLDEAISKFAKHTWKWTKSNLANATTSGIIKAFAGNKISSTFMSIGKELIGGLV